MTNDFIDAFGWWALGFTLLGLTASLFAMTYALGFKRGLGQFRLSNPFGERPILPRDDQQYINDYKRAVRNTQEARYRLIKLEQDHTALLEQYDALVEKNKKTASARRAQTRARNAEVKKTASDG